VCNNFDLSKRTRNRSEDENNSMIILLYLLVKEGVNEDVVDLLNGLLISF